MQNYPDASSHCSLFYRSLLQYSSLLHLSRVLFLCLFCLLSSQLLSAQVVSNEEKINARVEKDREQVLIGDPIKLKIEIQHPVGKSYQLSLDERGLSFLELRGHPSISTQAIDGQQATTTIEVALTPFQTGKLPIPSLLILRNDGKQLQSPAVELTVEAITAPEERTIKDVQLMPETPSNGWLQATIIAVLLASAGIYFMVRVVDPYASRWILAAMGLVARRSQPAEVVAPQPRISLEEEMIARLRLLLASDLSQRDVKSYHVQLAEIMTEYAIRRYQAPLREYTSIELLDLLTLRSVPTLVVSAFERILSACDLVKFARWLPDQETSQRSARQAIDLLNALNHGAQTTIQKSSRQNSTSASDRNNGGSQ